MIRYDMIYNCSLVATQWQ